MKRYTRCILAIITILFLVCSYGYAYTGDGYSIDIPSGYKQQSDNVWTKGKKISFNVNIVKNTENASATKATLEKTVEELEDKHDFKVEDYEVTRLPGNKYKCIYIKSTLNGIHQVQYSVPSRDKIYTLTFQAQDESYIDSDEVDEILESFSIKNYKEPKSSSITSAMLIGMGIGAVSFIVIVVVVIIIANSKKKNMV